MIPLQIEYRPVEVLIPHARNAREHSDAPVAQIAAGIREFGWGAPTLVDGANNVVAGHGRLLAARKPGMTEVPVAPMAHLTDIQRRALSPAAAAAPQTIRSSGRVILRITS